MIQNLQSKYIYMYKIYLNTLKYKNSKFLEKKLIHNHDDFIYRWKLDKKFLEKTFLIWTCVSLYITTCKRGKGLGTMTVDQ